jgi:hypothetical protein
MPLPTLTYKKKYTHQFTSVNGNVCVLDIYSKLAKKEPLKTIYGTGINVSIDFGSSGSDVFTVMRPKILTLRLWSDDNELYQEFFNTDIFGFYCIFKINNVEEFRGWIMPDVHNEAFTTPPFDISIKFGCGLFLLKDNFVKCPFGQLTILNFLRQGFNINNFKFDIVDLVGFYEENHYTLTGNEQRATLKNTLIPIEPLRGLSLWEAFQEVLGSFCCEVFQHKGRWIVRRNDLSKATLSGCRYSEAGDLIDVVNYQFNETITGINTTIANRINWRDNSQELEFIPAYKELNLEIPKDVTDNFFVTGGDFEDDCEWLTFTPNENAIGTLKFYNATEDFNDPTPRNILRLQNGSLFVSQGKCLNLQFNALKYSLNPKRGLKFSITVKSNNPNYELYKCYYAPGFGFFVEYPTAPLPQATTIVFNISFGNIEANKLYYMQNTTAVTLSSFGGPKYGNKFNVSYDPIGTQIVDVDTLQIQDFQAGLFVPHLKTQIIMLKNESPIQYYYLAGNGKWYTTPQIYSLALPQRTISEFDFSENIVLNGSSIDNIPIPNGLLYYKVKSEVSPLIGIYFAIYKSIKFELIDDPLLRFGRKNTINSNQKEIYNYKLLFTDTPKESNPHLVYKNYLMVNNILTFSNKWKRDFTVGGYMQHYEQVEKILTDQNKSRRAILRGSINATKQITAFNLKEKNFKNLTFKNVFCKFIPKFDTYQGEWHELYAPKLFEPVPNGGVDSSFDSSFN